MKDAPVWIKVCTDIAITVLIGGVMLGMWPILSGWPAKAFLIIGEIGVWLLGQSIIWVSNALTP